MAFAIVFVFFVRILFSLISTMKKNILAGMFLMLTTLSYAQDDATKYAESITPQDLKKHLVIIASDSLEGRDTGSPGQKKAAEYVSKYFKSYGLQPIADNGEGAKSYLQKYKLYKRSYGDVYVKIDGKKYTFNKDFYLNGLLSVPEETEAPVVLVGYGIEEGTYNDYANLDVNG